MTEQKQVKVEPIKGIVKIKIDEQGKVTKELVKKEITKFMHNHYDVTAYSNKDKQSKQACY